MNVSRRRLVHNAMVVLLCAALLVLSLPLPAYAQSGTGTPTNPTKSHPSHGQDLRFDHLTTEDGLSSNEVLCILQDSHGFVWIGTFNGLNRYDGHTITVYKNELDDPNSLSSNIIRAIHEDQQGVLWIATSNGGLNRFDPATQTFSHYLNDPEDPNSLNDNSIISLSADSDGILWLGTLNDGLDRFDSATETFSHYPQLGGGSVERIIEDSAGNLWIALFGSGLAKLNPETGVITRYRHDPENPDSLATDKLRWVYADTEDNLWIAAHDGGLDRLVQETEDSQAARFFHYRYDPDIQHGIMDGLIVRIFEDSSGTIWVGGANGLAKFSPQTDRFTHYLHSGTDPHSLSHNVITAFTEDQAGILWFGTFGGGVSIHNPATQRFTRYGHDPDDPNSLGLGGVKAAYVDASGNIWLGNSNEGVDKIDQTSGQITHYRHDPENPHSLSSDKVFAVFEDSTGVLWIGTWGGLDQFDWESEQFHHIHDARILTAYEDRSKVMWFGTVDDGLLRFDRETERFQLFEYDPDPSATGLSDRAVSAILEDSSGAFWVGTWNGGLNLFDRNTGQVLRVFRHDPNDPGSLSNDRVEVLYEDLAGGLWITTGNGVNRFDRESETFIHYTDKDGLPDSFVNAILEEVPGDAPEGRGVKLWFGTKKGLARFDPQTEAFRNYDTSDGLQGDSSSRGHVKGPDGQMIFGNETGLTTFNPDQIVDDLYVPPIVLTNLKLLNESVPIGGDSPLQQAIWETEHLNLSYEDDIITFEFAALSYANPKQNLLQYKIEGFDDDWSPPNTNHSATYTNLDPGNYVFRVRGSSSDGVWNEEGTSLNITIRPPWWETWWFRGVALLLLVAAAFAGYRWRVGSLEARSRGLEAQVAVKTRALNERVNELDCLYGISRLAGTQGISLEEVLQGAVELIPQPLQYPEIACARIVLDEQEYRTENFQETPWQQTTAIRVHDEQTGMIQVCYLEESPERDEGPFLQEERVLLDAIAERLGRIAERMQAEAALRKTRDELATILAVSRDITSTLDLKPLLNLILDQLRRVVDYDGATIMTLSEDILEEQAYQGLSLDVDPLSLRVRTASVSPMRQLVVTRQPFIIDDVHLEPGLSEELQEGAGYDVDTLFGQSHSWMGVPMIVSDRVIGMLGLIHREPGYYQTDALPLAQAFANQVAIAVENAELYRQARETATLEERTRLARELHDSATQALYSALLFSETGKKLTAAGDLEAAQHYQERAGEVIQQALKEMRLVVYELRPPELEKEGLVGALQLRLDAVESRVGMEARLNAGELPALPAEVAEHLYRVTLEALNNVLKHAQADAVTVSLQSEGEIVTLEVADNGQGFDPDAVRDGGGLGLPGIQERVQELGGELAIDSAPGQGTRLSVCVEVAK